MLQYQIPRKTWLKPNRWDLIALSILLCLLGGLGFSASKMNIPYPLPTPLTISLSPWMLPHYASNTMLRMLIAFMFSLLATFTLAPLMAKNKRAEKCLVPLIDILQSVPILGFLSITIVFFMKLFPHTLLGPECAAIFAIFTAQVWNMILSFYQSLKTVPKSFYDVAHIFHLSAWQCFWRVEVPYAIPGLLWNSMISASAGWFFLVAVEAISVNNQSILLPGIGSYINIAIQHMDIRALYYATFTMFVVILGYDQLLFRPLLSWASRFENHDSVDGITTSRSWVYQALLKSHWLKIVGRFIGHCFGLFFTGLPRAHAIALAKAGRNDAVVFGKNVQEIQRDPLSPCGRGSRVAGGEGTSSTVSPLIRHCVPPSPARGEGKTFWKTMLIGFAGLCLFMLWRSLNNFRFTIGLHEIGYIFYLGAVTCFKIGVLVLLCSLFWVPVGVWIGFRPKLTQHVQPIIQFLAAFPANLMYPIAVTLILKFHLNINLWTAPLMILGTQWYMLFNVIGGTRQIPKDLLLASRSLGLKGWLRWKKLLLPAIFPYYVTGSMTTVAGCWNASIISEILSWGDHTLVALGLGSYITQQSNVGDFQRVSLGIIVMCFYVLVINRLLWRPLYNFASTRFVLE